MTIRQIHSSSIVITVQYGVLLCLFGCYGSTKALEKSETAQAVSAASASRTRPTPDGSDAGGPIEKTIEHALIRIRNPDDGDQRVASVREGLEQETTNSSNEPVPTETDNSLRKPKTRKAIPDVDATVRIVESLLEKARKAKNRKDYGNAFRFTSEAWEATSFHPNDSRIRKHADEISIELEALAAQANSQFSARAANTSTILIEK